MNIKALLIATVAVGGLYFFNKKQTGSNANQSLDPSVPIVPGPTNPNAIVPAVAPMFSVGQILKTTAAVSATKHKRNALGFVLPAFETVTFPASSTLGRITSVLAVNGVEYSIRLADYTIKVKQQAGLTL